MFALSAVQRAKLKEWRREQDTKTAENQRVGREARKAAGEPGPFDDMPLPYYGAIGGVLTYKFTPTGLGTKIVVEHGGTNKEIDLSEYSAW